MSVTILQPQVTIFGRDGGAAEEVTDETPTCCQHILSTTCSSNNSLRVFLANEPRALGVCLHSARRNDAKLVQNLRIVPLGDTRAHARTRSMLLMLSTSYTRVGLCAIRLASQRVHRTIKVVSLPFHFLSFLYRFFYRPFLTV